MAGKLRTLLSYSMVALILGVGAIMLALLLPTGWKIFSVQSGSMEPALSTGDLVFVHSIPASQYEIGDVITYVDPDNPKQTITHRIAAIDQGTRRVFTTQGDANRTTDRPFSEAMVVGRQEFAVPLFGRAVDFIFTLPGLLLAIWLPALWLISGETKRLANYYRRIRPYLAPGVEPHIIRPHKHTTSAALLATGLVLAASLGAAVPALALAQDSATLTDNTITVRAAEDDETGTTINCTNSTNIGINSTTNQSATSGEASVQGNTSGGSASSGSASNSTSTSIGISVNNGSCVPSVPVQ